MADGFRLRLALVVVLCWGAPLAGAHEPGQMQASTSGETTFEREQTAPVIVDGVTLFRVRGVSAYPAEMRAGNIAERIVALAEDPGFAVDQLRLDQQEDSIAIMGGNVAVMFVHDADARLEGGVRTSVLASATSSRIGESIRAWRKDRSPERLQSNGLLALGATLAVGLALWGVAALFQWLRGFNRARFGQKIRDVQVSGFRILGAGQITSVMDAALNLLWIVFVLATVYIYVSTVLVLFPWTRWIAEDLVEIVVNPLRVIGIGFLNQVPNLVFLAVLFFFTRYLLKLIHLFFNGVENGSVKLKEFDEDWAMPTYKLVRVLVIVLAVIVAYPYIPGSESDAFKGISIFLGVVLSIGSSTIVGNMVAGYSMIYRRIFKVGDRVLINDFLGDVVDVRILVTYLKTVKNEVVAIPNSEIVNSGVVNYSTRAKTDGLILHTTVGIGYETPWRQVEAMLLEAAARTPHLKKDSPPFVLQKALGDFCVTYELNAYTDDEHNQARRYTDLHRNVIDVFNEYGVQIMTPAYEGDPERPKIVPPEQWYSAPARPPEPLSQK